VNQPGGESARGQKSHGANIHGAKQQRGEKATILPEYAHCAHGQQCPEALKLLCENDVVHTC